MGPGGREPEAKVGVGEVGGVICIMSPPAEGTGAGDGAGAGAGTNVRLQLPVCSEV